MKYKRIILSLCLLSVIAILGVFIYSKTEVLRALTRFAKMENVHVEGTVTLYFDNYPINLKGTANYANNIVVSNLTTDYIWNPINLELYAKIEDDKISFNLFNNISDVCFNSIQKVSGSNIKKNNFNIKKINLKKVKSDKKGQKKYQIEVPKKYVLSILLDKDFNISEEDKIIVYFYIQNSKVTGIEAKEERLYLSEEKNIYFSNFNLTFSSWGTISNLSIPIEKTDKCKEIDNNMLKEIFS